MHWILRKIKKKVLDSTINTNYDLYNSEVSELTTINSYSGIRTEISKTIYPYFQFTNVSVIDSNSYVKQVFGTLSLRNTLLQLSIDQDKNVQLRGTLMYKNIISKFNTVVSKKKEVFSQVDVSFRNKINNLCFKLIQPAIYGSSLIYVFNYIQQFGLLSFGSEIIGTESYLGLSFISRYESKSSITTLSLQQFNSLTLDYFKRLNKMIDVGIKANVSRVAPFSYGLGFKLHSDKAEVKTCITNEGRLGFNYDDKLSEGLSLNINCEVGKGFLAYGYGFTYEF